MAFWRHPLRLGLALLVAGVSAAVLLNLRERAEPVQAVVVERTDPDAIIQTRGSEIVQADALGDNIRVVAGSQMTYAGGGLRMADGVEVTVAEREGRDGFVLRSASATVDAGETEVALSGGVQLIAGGDLEASTAAAQYSEADGVVRMPEAATFVRGDMQASASSAAYERIADRLQLLSSASVALSGAGDTRTTMGAESATVAQREGFMSFGGGVSIAAGSLTMEAPEARVELVPDTSQLKALALSAGVQVAGSEPGAGQLRTMAAEDIELAYGEDGAAFERAELTGGARLALAGAEADAGTEIASSSMEIVFGADSSAISGLAARDDVTLELPAQGSSPARNIDADALDVEGLSGDGPEEARFEGAVEYREQGRPEPRVARAELLEATLGGGLSSLEAATFRGGVTFEDGDVVGQGDEARYLIADEAVELVPAEEDGRTPEVVYTGGTVRAGTIRVGFVGPQIGAQGSVESVLRHTAGEDGDAELPGLLAVEPVLVTANQLTYDGAEQLVMNAGAAHLWQGETAFRGGLLVLDEATGNLLLDGAVETTFSITRVNRETDEPETSLSTGTAESMRYEKELHRVTYTAGARLDGPQGDLQADRIQVQLQADDVTLDHVTATGNVTLLVPGRIVSGERLVYHDETGRYEMEGAPVRFVEAAGEEEGCRETLGRTLTFFASVDDISVDGQYQRRTATASGACPEQLLK
ncbi:MAG: hypothetical protein F4Y57_02300 [Acidobacteria bacterium]|nr:hypothetical protein [Acidobacteriota bacterium]